jgi:hypothetical protein
VHHLVEADIRGFFDAVHPEWLLKFLQQRIGDPRVLRLIRRMLKAGILEDGLVEASEVGTPQGSILSTLLSNVYLHYVLDLWLQRRVRRRCRGEAYVFRFADDFRACFQHQTDAEAFLERLGDRLEGFHLELAKEKTRRLEFGRYARADAYQRGGKPKEFDFLGMTFFGGKTRHGVFKVKRKTSRQKLRQSLARFTDWIRRLRNLVPTGELLRQAKARIQGHRNYYAITDNAKMATVPTFDAPGVVQMAQSAEPTQVVYLERLPTGLRACRLAPGACASQPEPFCSAEWLNEEPYMGKPFVRFCEGMRHNRCMAEILWHRRETRRQTENTNVIPGALGVLILLDKYSNSSSHRRLRLYHRLRCGLSSASLCPILSITIDGKA